MNLRRKKDGYFKRLEGSPKPLTIRIKRRVKFSEVDLMGIVWYGRYAEFFEEATAELGRLCSLSYEDFYKANIRAPIVQFHIDYYQPFTLDEEFTICASLIWNDAAKLHTEYTLLKHDGSIAATGYTVQMFTDSISGQPFLASPELLENCRNKWKMGEISCH